jgi:hypothetical protein
MVLQHEIGLKSLTFDGLGSLMIKDIVVAFTCLALLYDPRLGSLRSDSNYDVKVSTVQFYTIKHNSKSNRWIELKFYQKILDVFVYLRVHFLVNQRSERTCNTG